MFVAGSGGLRGAVVVTGDGSKLTTGHSVTASDFGGYGRIRVEKGGEWVQSGTTTRIFNGTTHTGEGRLEIDDGSVQVQNLTIGQKGILDVTLHAEGFGALITHTPNVASLTLASGTGGTATLEVKLAPDFTAGLGQTFTLLQHIDSGLATSNWTVSGQFLHTSGLLSHGSTFTVDDYEFEVGITDGAGGSYTLTVIPEPGALGLMGVAALVLTALRRRRI